MSGVRTGYSDYLLDKDTEHETSYELPDWYVEYLDNLADTYGHDIASKNALTGLRKISTKFRFTPEEANKKRV